MDSVGVIGVGHIGKGFVERLLDADREVVAYDIDERQLEWAEEQGAAVATSPAAVTEGVEVVVMAVPGTPEVEAVVGGPDGVLDGGEDGQVIVDATTTLPRTSVECAALCAEHGMAFLEAPITGGSPREGMHMMIGGDAETYDHAADLLDLLCEDHVRIGPVGDAMVFKLGIQLRYAGRKALDAEIVEFLRDNDVDARPLVDFLEFDVSDRYFSGDYSQGIEGLGGLAIWHKDIGYARKVAQEGTTALPLGMVLHEAYKAAIRRVGDDEGSSAALIRYWEALNDAEGRAESADWDG